jgi:hypothetical protein
MESSFEEFLRDGLKFFFCLRGKEILEFIMNKNVSQMKHHNILCDYLNS